MNAHVEKLFESEHVRTSMKVLLTILYAKYEKPDKQVIKNQCRNLIEEQRNELVELFPKFEELFDGTLGRNQWT